MSEQPIESFFDNLNCLYIYFKGKRHETESVVQHSKEGTSESSHSTQSVLTQDELLIELVRTRRSLWDHSIPLNERTRLKKDSLWQEIVNVFDGKIIF